MRNMNSGIIAIEKHWRIIFILATVLFAILLHICIRIDTIICGAIAFFCSFFYLTIFMIYLGCFVLRIRYKKAENDKAADDAITYEHITEEFGEGFVFSSQPMGVTKEDVTEYMHGKCKRIDEKYNFVRLEYYESKRYRKILCLSRKIPPFDSSDREYDSWHDLYLLQEHNGILRAVYATGGYNIAHVEGYARVYDIPERLKKYLK